MIVFVLWLFLIMLWVGLQCVIVVFSHTHLLFYAHVDLGLADKVSLDQTAYIDRDDHLLPWHLTLCILMNSSISFDTMSPGWLNVCIKGSQVRYSKLRSISAP